MKIQCWLVLGFALLGGSAFGETVESHYRSFCASCHGKDLSGGMGSPLNDNEWKYGSDHQSISRVIRDGLPKAGMPAFNKTLSSEDIRALTIFIQEQAHEAVSEKRSKASVDDTFSGNGHQFKLQKMAEAPGELWGFDFLPDGDILATQVDGVLWRIRDGELHKIKGIPSVWRRGQGGLLDVRVDPEHIKNGWIYLSYSEPKSDQSMTKVVRGKIKDDEWRMQQVVYEAPASSYGPTHHHFGSRIAFRGEHLFFTVGDRGEKSPAQDLQSPKGKVHRVTKEGKVPKDNPWANSKDGLDTVWTLGHRNPQGIAVHPNTGDIWVSEHGPRGGDEINLLQKGENYGWPTVTYGMNYDGTPMTDKTTAKGMKQPQHYWVPSIAVSDIEFYRGDVFPKWQAQLLVSSLAKQEVRLLRINDRNEVTDDTLLLKGLGRLRDIAVDMQGFPYMLNGDMVYRFVPAAEADDQKEDKEKQSRKETDGEESQKEDAIQKETKEAVES